MLQITVQIVGYANRVTRGIFKKYSPFYFKYLCEKVDILANNYPLKFIVKFTVELYKMYIVFIHKV